MHIKRFTKACLMGLGLTLPLALSVLLSAGCTPGSLGIGSPSYHCPAPQGGVCRSVSEIHDSITGGDAFPQDPVRLSALPLPSISEGKEHGQEIVRTPPTVLQVWVAPYVDADGDYIGEQTIHMVADVGEWSIAPRANPPAGSDAVPASE